MLTPVQRSRHQPAVLNASLFGSVSCANHAVTTFRLSMNRSRSGEVLQENLFMLPLSGDVARDGFAASQQATPKPPTQKTVSTAQLGEMAEGVRPPGEPEFSRKQTTSVFAAVRQPE